MQKIVTCLGFDNQAEEAMNFYVSVFGGKVLGLSRYPDGSRMPKGTLLAGTFEINGQEFMVLNGGPQFTHSSGMSIVVRCENQAEVDRIWEKLTEGGQEVACGWLTDKYGISWQIVPRAFIQMVNDKNPAKSQAAMNAMMTMKKLDLPALQAAYERA